MKTGLMVEEVKAANKAENNTGRIRVRIAQPEDAAALARIYAYYVTDTAISFEYEAPSAKKFAKNMAQIEERYPFLLAEDTESGAVLGYACAHPFINRPAYDWGVETTIYVDKECKKSGVGRALYEALESVLSMQHILNVNACIATPAGPGTERYVSTNSMEFHAHMGYRLVGEFHNCGYKFGLWFHMVWMEKMIGMHPGAEGDEEHQSGNKIQPPVIPFAKIREEAAELLKKAEKSSIKA